MKKDYLFLFTIGPVQGFIAQARKTRDLYAGSKILSALARAGIDAFESVFPNPGGKIIFPYFVDRGQATVSLPNRFIGQIQHYEGSDEALRAAGDFIKSSVIEAFREIAGEALLNAGISKNDAPKGFNEQLEAHLDVFWAYEEVSGSYADTYLNLEHLLGAVKNVRPFSQYTYDGIGETGRKCSMDGASNALFYRPTESGNIPAYIYHGCSVPRFELNPGEGLGAVSFVKRFSSGVEPFPSTAEVALMHDEKKLSDEQKKYLSCFKQLFEKSEVPRVCLELTQSGLINKFEINYFQHWNNSFDYQFLFEENLNPKNFPDDQQLGLLRLLQAKLKSTLKTKYYAVVLFDGDKMGKWLSGENNISTDNLADFHTALSTQLSAFGSEAYQILSEEKHNGQAVYAGGDDFLGFVNIHSLFEVMEKLRDKFDEIVNQKITDFKRPDKHLTFSAGIVIAHYKTPFSEVLKTARHIEKKAKNAGDRNAFAITVLKHSGEVHEAVFKWDTDPRHPSNCSNWIALKKIAQAIEKEGEEGHFSNTFIQGLTREVYQLAGSEMKELTGRQFPNLNTAMHTEIGRLVARALDVFDNQETDSKRVERLTKAVVQLWDHASSSSEGETRKRIPNFIHALHIADFITRKTSQQ